MPKLTLNVDEKVVSRAKRFAGSRHTSVSQLVERFLRLLPRPEVEPQPPVLDELRGTLKSGKVQSRDYRKHLEDKYR
jgi:hypothetical protein